MSLPVLRVISAQGPDQVFEVAGDEILIGRKSDTDIVLIDPYVSRHHAKMVKRADHYTLVDLQSSHGSYVNGERVERRIIRHGDRIRLGRLELVFSAGGREAGGLAPGDLALSINQLSSVFTAPDIDQASDLEKINWLLDFQQQWGQQFSSERTFQQILKSALKISGAERGFILVSEKTSFEYAVGMDGEGEVMTEAEFQTSRSVVRKVAATGEPVFMTEGIEGELAQQQSILEMNLRAVACLPLRGMHSDAESDREQILGILYPDSTKTMHALSGLDQKIMNRLAVEAGNVFEKLQDQEHRGPQTVRAGTGGGLRNPEEPASAATSGVWQLHDLRLQPTDPLRGRRLYEFLKVRKGRLLGVLADVSGKGVPAALLSSLVQGALDMECRQGSLLHKAQDRVNAFLVERSPASRFVTLFLFSIDARGQGEFLSAGHNPAYLYRAATGEVEELTSEDLILGAFDFASYSSHPLELCPGDVLVIYSDGVTDAENPNHEMFEEERLLKIVRDQAGSGARVLEKQILGALSEFTQGRAQTDDITFLLIERGKAADPTPD